MSSPSIGGKAGIRPILLAFFIWTQLSGATSARAEDYAQWAHSMRIKINTTSTGAGISTLVNNFPMLVRLPAGHAAFSGAKAGGADIRFSDPDGSHLGYEIERWDAAAGKAEIWVKVPVVDGNSDQDYFTMHWGKPDAPARSDGPAVFASDSQVATWHFAEKGSATRANSAQAAHSALPANYDGDEDREGMVGRCDSLDGGEPGDYLDLGEGFADFTTGFTFSAWVSSSSEPSWSHILDLGNGRENDNVVVAREASGVNPAIMTYGSGVDGDRLASGSGGLERNRWRHLAFTLSGSQAKVFVDGALAASGNVVIALAKVTRTRNYIGKSNWSNNPYFKGKVDEAAIAKSIRSPEWIKLSYESQKSGSKVLSFQDASSDGLSLLSSPASISVPEGASVAFTATAVSYRDISYRWYRDGLPLGLDGKPLLSPTPNLLLTPEFGAVRLELSIPSASLSSAGSYVCVLNDGKDTVKTVPALLTVSENKALWTRSMKIGFNTTSTGAAVNSAQKNFPVPIRLNASNFNFAEAAPAGRDIRALDADGAPLAFQVALWDTTSKQAEIWLRVPEIAGNSDADHITLLWGRTDAVAASNPAEVFRAEEGYQGVWHLNDSEMVAADATGKVNPGKSTGPTVGQPGILGLAYGFDHQGVNHISLPPKVTSGLKAFTLTLWAKETESHICLVALPCPTLFGGESPGGGSGDFWISSDAGRLFAYTGLASGGDSELSSAASINDGKWHFVAVTYDGADFSLYEAGRIQDSKRAGGKALDGQSWDIGNLHWSDDSHNSGFDGYIDAVQFAAAARSADWMKLAFETQRADGATMEYGPTSKSAPPQPSIHPAAGAYAAPLTVTLASADSGLNMLYTLDGSVPVPGKVGTLAYTKPLVLDRGATVKAIAYRDGLVSSPASAAYVLQRLLLEKDSLVSGEAAALAGGHQLQYPAQNGTLSVTVETGVGADSIPAGFAAIGGPIRVSSAGPAFPALQVVLAGVREPVSLFRLEGGAIVSWALSAADTLSITSAGAYFWGADIQSPVIRIVSAPKVSDDTLRAVFRLEDNVRNLLCELHYWNGAADSTGWAACAVGGDIEGRVPMPARNHVPLEIRFSATDRAIVSRYPDGLSHALTVSRPIPSLPSPIALAAGGKWALAALPLAPAEHIHLKDLAAANGGGTLSAGIWQTRPDLPEQGTYKILGLEDTLPAGVGFWLASEKAIGNLVLPPARTLASDSEGCFPMRFTRGWNLVAGPTLRALPWIANRGDGDAYMQSDLKMLHRFTGSGYVETDSIRPWEGYFVYHHGGDTTIRLRASAIVSGALAKSAPSLAPVPEAGISLQLAAPAGGPMLRLGARAWASDGLGVEDEPLPPSGLAAAPALRLLRDGRALGSDFVRLRADEAMSWTLAIKASAPGGSLRILQSRLPVGYQAWAVSRAGKVKLRLGPDGALPMSAGDTVIVYAGSTRALADLPELRGYRESPALAECLLRPGPLGPDLSLALPGIARVTLTVWRADGSRRAGWGSRELGPGWHSLPLAGDGASVLPRGAYWVEVEARGQGWRFRRLIPYSRL